MFSQVSVCPRGWCLGPGPGGRLGGLAEGVSRPTSRAGWGEEVGGSGQGVSKPKTWGGEVGGLARGIKSSGPHPGGVQAQVGGYPSMH